MPVNRLGDSAGGFHIRPDGKLLVVPVPVVEMHWSGAWQEQY